MDDAREFWEDRYREGKRSTSGKPSAALKQWVTGRVPGRALELGCGRGDDAVWLARQRWQVTAVDLADAALEVAAENAWNAGIGRRIVFERHDVQESLPEGPFDLVTSLFMQSPIEFDRHGALYRAARLVAPGGLMLVVAHAAPPPWSEAPEGYVFPTAAGDLAALGLDDGWRVLCAESQSRIGTGPEGQTGEMLDAVVAVERVR